MTFLETIDPRRIPGHLDPENDLLVFRERILQYILIGMAVLGAVGYVAATWTSFQRQLWVLITLYTVVYLAVLLITSIRSLEYNLRAGFVLVVLYLLGLSGLLESGLSGDGRVFLIVFTMMSAVFLGIRSAVWASGLSVITLAGVGTLMSTGVIALPPLEIMANSGSLTDWTTGTIIFGTLVVLSVMSLQQLTRGLERTVNRQKQLASDLRREQSSLEERVELRTVELQRRAAGLEAAGRLARDITSSTQLNSLLVNAVNLIQEEFGFYHAGIFLLDGRGEFAVLKAATGEAGQAMLNSGHRLKTGEVGIVGYVVSKGEARITSDVEQDPFHYKNPFLPDTRAEMALPIQTGGKMMGVLDVQSTVPGAFSEDDIKILQTIADQLAVAIDKALLVEQLQSSLAEIQESHQQQTQQTWRYHLTDTRKAHAYRYRRSEIETGVPESLQAHEAYSLQKTIVTTQKEGETGKPVSVVSIPIVIRQQVIGVLDVHVEKEHVTDDLVDLLEATTHRMALALENARLLEAIQLKAEREHMVSDISARVRSSTNIDGILRTAASELGRSFGISEVLVQLRTEKS